MIDDDRSACDLTVEECIEELSRLGYAVTLMKDADGTGYGAIASGATFALGASTSGAAANALRALVFEAWCVADTSPEGVS